MQKKSSSQGSNTYTIDLEENEKLEYAKEQVVNKRGLNPNLKKLVVQNKSMFWDEDELFELFDPSTKNDLSLKKTESSNNDHLIQHLLESQKRHQKEIEELKTIVQELTRKMNEQKKIQ